MIARIARLVAAEGMKLAAQRFLFIAIPFIVVGVLAPAIGIPALMGKKEGEWGGFNAYQLFTYGAKLGVSIASYMLIIFASLLFAGEFDRGTIKVLLTRPVTRTEIFVSKVTICFLLAIALYGVVLFVSLLYGVARGDLGPVWDTTAYEMKRTGEQMDRYLRTTILVGFLPILAAGALGILVSNLTDTSWVAIVTGIIGYLLLNLVTGFLPEKWQMKIFNYYLSDGFDLLRRYAEGEGTLGYEPGHEKEWYSNRTFVTVPLLYIAGFLGAAYGIFRSKNVHA